MFYLVARFFCPALRTLQPKTFSLTLQKRSRQARPTYELPTDGSGRFLTKFASSFGKKHLDALRVRFEPADNHHGKTEKIFPPRVEPKVLKDDDFNVEKLGLEDDRVRTFVDKLHDVTENSGVDTGTSEALTDTLVNDLLLHVVNFDDWPFKVRLEPPLNLITSDESVSAEPKFVINNFLKQDKHLINKKTYPLNSFGECQIAAEILACGYENIIEECADQEIFAFRVISTYVTFYKAVIPAMYWWELQFGLSKEQSVVIKRWPKENGEKTGLNLADPEGRRAVITDLLKIRQHLLG
ncbi:hypothetical protein RclHR1_00020011 [Rhizophagus clarus]|uniref:Uncharacterized protein n=1 Tax=Rhizophagus clarus TaxID=94130 RepID=A0A2Z6RIJ5_9GLOM|nr:hypothetical protein RclHR1_00020011 [Rhizophagus clarus]